MVYVQAGATGQGESQEQCDQRAELINNWTELGHSAANFGDFESAMLAWGNAIEEVENAENAGCFIVFKKASPRKSRRR